MSPSVADASTTGRRPAPKGQRLASLKNPQPRPLSSLNQNKHVNQSGHVPSARQCPNSNCQSTDVGEEDGQIICRACGTVISESNIVAEVQFAETSNGGHLMIGQHVGSDQAHARGTLGALRNAGGMTAREQTHANGKRHIYQIGTAYKVPQKLIDQGMNVFVLATANNFNQGRNTRHVAAASLYIASRLQSDNSHRYMLIDFSDILQLDVFRLGQIYKDLVEVLRINGTSLQIKPINPENLLHRFAERGEFGKDQNKVAMDGVRVLQRMNRDWMTPGRRPAGICGAALLIAGRMNNYRCSLREIAVAAKITESTLEKRLKEFGKTGSGGLTVDEFRKIDLEHASDPPAFSEQNSGKGRRKRKHTVEEFDDDGDSDVESQRATPVPISNPNERLQTPPDTQPRSQTEMQSMPPPPIPAQAVQQDPQGSAKKKRGRPPKQRTPIARDPLLAARSSSNEVSIDPSIATAMSDPSSFAHASALTQTLDTDEDITTPPSTQQGPESTTRAPVLSTEEISDSEFGSDLELSACLLTPSEVEIKTRIWMHENQDWVRAQHAKELRRQLAEENGTTPKVKRRTRKRTRMGDMASYRRESGQHGASGVDQYNDDAMPAGSPQEAVEKMMKKRGYSKKINYEALTKLYQVSPRSSSASSSRRESLSGASGVVASPGAGDFFASPRPTVAIEVTAPSDDTGGEDVDAEPVNLTRSDDEVEVEQATPVDMDDIQAIAREEEEERRLLSPGKAIVPPGSFADEHEDEDEDDDPDDYYSDKEGGDTIEDILKEAKEKEHDDDEDAGDDDDYDYD